MSDFYKHPYVKLFNRMYGNMYFRTALNNGITLERIWHDKGGSSNPKVHEKMDAILTIASEALKEQTK